MRKGGQYGDFTMTLATSTINVCFKGKEILFVVVFLSSDLLMVARPHRHTSNTHAHNNNTFTMFSKVRKGLG